MFEGSGCVEVGKDVLFGLKRTNNLFSLVRGGQIHSGRGRCRATMVGFGRGRVNACQGWFGWSGKGRTWPESVKFGFKG